MTGPDAEKADRRSETPAAEAPAAGDDPLAGIVDGERTVVLFTARWAVAATLLGRGVVDVDAVVDVDDHPALAERYQVTTVPEVLILTGGEIRQRIVGAAVVDAVTRPRR